MTSATKFNAFVDKLSKGSINLNTSVYKVMLTNTAPTPSTNALYSDISSTEVASGNGYTTGGITVTGTGASNTTGTETIAGAAVTWTSSSSGFTFRYAVLYDSTSGVLVEYWDNGASITLNGANGDQFVWTPTGSALLTLA